MISGKSLTEHFIGNLPQFVGDVNTHAVAISVKAISASSGSSGGAVASSRVDHHDSRMMGSDSDCSMWAITLWGSQIQLSSYSGIILSH